MKISLIWNEHFLSLLFHNHVQSNSRSWWILL